MLFWLGEIDIQTPKGRFILTASAVVRVIRRRAATEEEVDYVHQYLETYFLVAPSRELERWYELYSELTAQPYYGPNIEPHPYNIQRAINFALWAKKLHVQIQEPYDALVEEEWEPPPLEKLKPFIQALTPSEIWGRKNVDSFIGLRLKDQRGKPIIGSRIRLKLPDGTTREGATNEDGELLITGITQDGTADITFLDHCKPGKAEAPVWPKEKEFKATVVDEIGNPVPGVWLWFKHGNASNLARTNDSGVATYKTSNDVEAVSVSFESADDLARLMQPIWSQSRGVARKDWVPAGDTTAIVTIFGGNIRKAVADTASLATSQPKETLELFLGAESTVDDPVTISVQPLVIVVRLLGELFDIDKCFLLPKALDDVQELIKLRKEYGVTNVLIVGHTDTSGKPDYNLDLSLERTSAMSAYLTNDADSWLEWYGDDKKQSKRWGTTEDTYMIETLLDGSTYDTTALGFQQWHNAEALRLGDYEELDEDGNVGPLTRKQLILDFMHREDTTVPGGTLIQVHGCGEYFPLDSSGENLDTNAAVVD